MGTTILNDVINMEKQEILNLQRQLQACQKDKENLQCELDSILYERLQNGRGNCLGKSSRLEQDLIDSCESISVLQQELMRLKQKNNYFEKVLCENQERSNQMHDKIEQLESTLEKTISEKESFCQQLASAEEKLKIVATQEEIQEQIKQNHENEVKVLMDQIEEYDGQIRIAQQHFAKKVKENSLLKDQLSQRDSEILEIQIDFEKIQTQNLEIMQFNEQRQEQERKTQLMLTDTIKSLELQLSAWEEKYFYVSEKNQELETRNRELKKIEENQKQLQALLVNVGTVLAPSSNRETENREGYSGSTLYLKKS